jgi:hypothetical protein
MEVIVVIFIIFILVKLFGSNSSSKKPPSYNSTISKNTPPGLSSRQKASTTIKNALDKSYSVSSKRISNQNAYKSWSASEDNELKKLFKNGKTVPEIAEIFGRNNGAIHARIKKLGLKNQQNIQSINATKHYDFYLFHFTDPKNIPSIKKYGLLSWEQLLNRKIEHYPASNELSRNLDRRYNLENYVRLSLNQNHPMFSAAIYYKRVESLIWLKINPNVIDLSGTLFSNTNATCNKVIINQFKDTALKSTDLQAEVLVKEKVDPSYIIFNSNNDPTFYERITQSSSAVDDDLPF